MPENLRPHLDGTITFGNIISLIGFLFAGFMAYSAMSAELQIQRVQLTAVQAQVSEITNLLTREAARDVTVREMQRRIEQLERRQAQ